jgi:hypothetical protein
MRIRMTSFFPDLNVWLALSVAGHSHSADAWQWANLLPRETRLIFCRYTQIGLLPHNQSGGYGGADVDAPESVERV